FLEWLSIGKIDLNAACSPSFLRLSAPTNSCRNAAYDSSWVARRNGTGRTTLRFAKLLRIRFFSVNEYAMSTPGRVRKTKVSESHRSQHTGQAWCIGTYDLVQKRERLAVARQPFSARAVT